MATTTSPANVSILSEIPTLPPAPDGGVRFSRAAYHRMFEIGVLSPEKRFELIDGEIVMMSPLRPSNSGLISRLNSFFTGAVGQDAICRIQSPIVVSDHSEPEPDVALVKFRDDDYFSRHPVPNDALLLVEVAESSLHLDLGKKLLLYAKSGITEYWVVDVHRQIVHVHRQPGAAGYQDVRECGADLTINPVALPGCQLDLGWLFR